MMIVVFQSGLDSNAFCGAADPEAAECKSNHSSFRIIQTSLITMLTSISFPVSQCLTAGTSVPRTATPARWCMNRFS